MNLSKLTTPELLAKLRTIETGAVYARGYERLRLETDWNAVCRELNTRAVEEVLTHS